jgi:hypothetical protein
MTAVASPALLTVDDDSEVSRSLAGTSASNTGRTTGSEMARLGDRCGLGRAGRRILACAWFTRSQRLRWGAWRGRLPVRGQELLVLQVVELVVDAGAVPDYASARDDVVVQVIAVTGSALRVSQQLRARSSAGMPLAPTCLRHRASGRALNDVTVHIGRMASRIVLTGLSFGLAPHGPPARRTTPFVHGR